MAVDRLILKVLLDILILVAVIGAFITVRFTVKPYQRGYFAEDLTIRLPYKSNTVPFKVLLGVGCGCNIITIIITEVLRDKQPITVSDKKYILGIALPKWLWESYIVIGVFVFGTACQQLAVDIGKLVIGRLRPHFYDICAPIPTGGIPAPYQYITNYTCSKTDRKDSRLSFPSGHSCFAMYSAVFIILYIQKRVAWNGSKLLRHFVQLSVLMFAWYVCLSRVSDHMHHWDDVTAGIFLGVVSGALAFFYVLQLENPETKIIHSIDDI